MDDNEILTAVREYKRTLRLIACMLCYLFVFDYDACLPACRWMLTARK